MKKFILSFVFVLSVLMTSTLVYAQDYRKLDDMTFQLQSLARDVHWGIVDSRMPRDQSRDLQILSSQLRSDIRNIEEAVVEMRSPVILHRKLDDVNRSVERMQRSLRDMAETRVDYHTNKYGSVGYTTVIGSAPGNIRELSRGLRDMDVLINVMLNDLRDCDHGPVLPPVPSHGPIHPRQFPSAYNHPSGYSQYQNRNNQPSFNKTVSIGGTKLVFGIK